MSITKEQTMFMSIKGIGLTSKKDMIGAEPEPSAMNKSGGLLLPCFGGGR